MKSRTALSGKVNYEPKPRGTCVAQEVPSDPQPRDGAPQQSQTSRCHGSMTFVTIQMRPRPDLNKPGQKPCHVLPK